MITIYKYNTTEVRAVVNPSTDSGEDYGIMKDHLFKLSFSSPLFIDFQIGDYAKIFGQLFRLNKDAEFEKNSKRDFEYTLIMEGVTYELTRTQYFTLNANDHFTEGKFSIRLQPLGFCGLIIANLNRVFPNENWQLGQVIDGDFETIEFNGSNCLQALSTIAERYKTEYLIEGRKIHLYKRQLNSGLTFEQGKGKALLKIGRKNQDANNIITRLYAFGSSRNLGTTYRNGAPRLRMADSLYVEKNVEQYGLYEATVVFDGSNGLPEVYPHRTGYVTNVTSPFAFTDADIDFDVNDYLLPGVTAKITFNTGMLAGITFEIASFNNSTKTFTINANTESQTIEMPSAEFKAAVGDSYVIVDITQPESYIIDAEEELRTKALEYIAKEGANKVSFPVTCNPFYFQENGIELKLGYIVRLLSDSINLDRQIRIYSYRRNYRNPNLYTVELADTSGAEPVIIKLLKSIKNA